MPERLGGVFMTKRYTNPLTLPYRTYRNWTLKLTKHSSNTICYFFSRNHIFPRLTAQINSAVTDNRVKINSAVQNIQYIVIC